MKTTRDEQKSLGCVVIFYGALFLGVYKRSWMLSVIGVSVPFIPLITYAVVGIIAMRTYLWLPFDERRSAESDKQQTASLTLTGFCFTSLSLLISFFKEEIKKGDPVPGGIILFFCCALVSFIAANIILRYRIKNLSDYASDAFIQNGFWCIIVGLWKFFRTNNLFPQIANAILALLIFYLGCLLLEIYFYMQFSKGFLTTPPPKPLR